MAKKDVEVTDLVTAWEKVPCGDLEINKFQARKQNVGERLDELAKNIEKNGLLHPIIIAISDDSPGKWEIVCGQRRFLAVRDELHRDEIMAGKIERSISLEEGLAISAAENVIRERMTQKDMMDVCATLYKRYQSIPMVVEETGLPNAWVRSYIKYDGLPDGLKALVDRKEINQALATKVQNAAEVGGMYDEKRAEELLEVLKKSDNVLQKGIMREAKKLQGSPIEDVVERAEQRRSVIQVKFELEQEAGQALENLASENGESINDAAEAMVLDTLESQGYLRDETVEDEEE